MRELRRRSRVSASVGLAAAAVMVGLTAGCSAGSAWQHADDRCDGRYERLRGDQPRRVHGGADDRSTGQRCPVGDTGGGDLHDVRSAGPVRR